ncbi:MAG: MFS transporter [Anaerolineaceae bacterium]|jgi:DHA3 family macrolide efflux protein-like MFS transporter
MEPNITESRKDNRWMKRFIPIWSAQVFSLLGSGVVQFAFVWWLTQKTGSAAVLTTATLVALLPEVLLSPFAGALVDRWNRRWVMIIADASIALVTLALVVLFALNRVEIWQIYVVLFLRSIGGIFHWPAMQASTTLMVPQEHYSRIAGINQAIRGALNIVAAPLGALLMTLLQFYQVVAVDVVTAAIAITPLLFIHIPQPVHEDAGSMLTPARLFKDIGEGFKFLKAWKGLLYLLLLAALLNFLLAPAGTLMPLLVTKHFGKGVWELSILESALGIGTVAGGLILGAWGGFKKRIVTSLTGVIGLGLGVAIMGLAPANAFIIGAVGCAFLGFMNPIANGPLQAIMQSTVPPEMQGRVMGVTTSVCTAMMPLSMAVAAPVAELLGIRTWFWAGGLLVMLAGGLGLFVPAIMTLESHKVHQPALEPGD